MKRRNWFRAQDPLKYQSYKVLNLSLKSSGTLMFK